MNRAWSAGEPVDHAAAEQLREVVLAANHDRYRAAAPAYRAFTDGVACHGPVTAREIAELLVLDEGFLKSYDPRWAESDLPALTAWLDTVCTVDLSGASGRAGTQVAWREELREAGVSVTFSSGTTGYPSLVPRDRATLANLARSGGVRFGWMDMPRPHDALLLVGDGFGSGLQSGAAGLARTANRTHRLTTIGSGAGADEADWDRAVAFLDGCASTCPVLVFGAPAAVLALAEHAGPRRLAAGSLVLTGGGPARDAAPVAPAELARRVSDRLGVPVGRCVDTYSTVELNTLLVSCAHGRYHVPPALGALALDPQMRPLPVPAQGRMAFLDPFALSYPGFLATGDQAVLRDDGCPCGLDGTTIDGPVRRAAGAVERGCGSAFGGAR